MAAAPLLLILACSSTNGLSRAAEGDQAEHEQRATEIPNEPAAPSSATLDWGPLAVTGDEIGFGLGEGARGTIGIGEECLTFTFENGFGPVTLVWQSAETSWVASTRRVVFMSQEYSDGDVVEFGGVGQPEFVIETWLNLPQECPEELWLVTSLDRAS